MRRRGERQTIPRHMVPRQWPHLSPHKRMTTRTGADRMRRTKSEMIADAIASLVRGNKDLTDEAIAKTAKMSQTIVTGMLNENIGEIYGKLPLGWKIGRAQNAVIVARPER